MKKEMSGKAVRRIKTELEEDKINNKNKDKKEDNIKK